MVLGFGVSVSGPGPADVAGAGATAAGISPQIPLPRSLRDLAGREFSARAAFFYPWF